MCMFTLPFLTFMIEMMTMDTSALCRDYFKQIRVWNIWLTLFYFTLYIICIYSANSSTTSIWFFFAYSFFILLFPASPVVLTRYWISNQNRGSQLWRATANVFKHKLITNCCQTHEACVRGKWSNEVVVTPLERSIESCPKCENSNAWLLCVVYDYAGWIAGWLATSCSSGFVMLLQIDENWSRVCAKISCSHYGSHIALVMGVIALLTNFLLTLNQGNFEEQLQL